MKARISEIFQSIQGEGPYAGVRQVFIRFFECHMHCSWCDTPDSIGDGRREYKEYSAQELFKAIKPLMKGCHSVSFTGGEPLLQAEFIKEFIPLLKASKLKMYLETSGVLYEGLKKIISDVDIVAMDIKLPSSTQCRALWKEHEKFLKIARMRGGNGQSDGISERDGDAQIPAHVIQKFFGSGIAKRTDGSSAIVKRTCVTGS